jgi:hypothetical protein
MGSRRVRRVREVFSQRTLREPTHCWIWISDARMQRKKRGTVGAKARGVLPAPSAGLLVTRPWGLTSRHRLFSCSGRSGSAGKRLHTPATCRAIARLRAWHGTKLALRHFGTGLRWFELDATGSIARVARPPRRPLLPSAPFPQQLRPFGAARLHPGPPEAASHHPNHHVLDHRPG